MAKHKIITEWIELNETYLGDGPPKIPYYEAGLWVNRCQIREGPRGRYLIRGTADIYQRPVAAGEGGSPL